MDFGVWFSIRNPERWHRPWPELYAGIIEQVEAAEALGYDAAWVSEHHFVEDGYCSGTLPMLAALSARTSRIRLGTNLMLLTMHHPLRVAEDGATVDIISNGRFMLGVGVGYRREEFTTFQIPLSERGSRMEEALQIVRKAWQGERFSFHGKHWQFDDIKVTPPPVQQPTPPIYVGGVAKSALERAARLADGLLLGVDTIDQQYDIYANKLRAEGGDPAASTIVFPNLIYVDEDRERAWHDCKEQILYQERLYRIWGEGAEAPVTTSPTQVSPSLLEKAEDVPDFLYIVGDPSQVIEAIERWRAKAPFNHLCFWAQPPGLSKEKAMRSAELFAEKVIPHFNGINPSLPLSQYNTRSQL